MVQIQALTEQNLKLEQDHDLKDELEKASQQLDQIKKDNSYSQIIIEQLKLEIKTKDEQLEQNRLAMDDASGNLKVKESELQNSLEKQKELESELRKQQEQL